MERLEKLVDEVRDLPNSQSFQKLSELIDLTEEKDVIRLLVNMFDEKCHDSHMSFRFNMFRFCKKETVLKVFDALGISADMYFYELVNLNDLDRVEELSAKMLEYLPALNQEQWKFLLQSLRRLQQYEDAENFDGQLSACHKELDKLFTKQIHLSKPKWIVTPNGETLPEEYPPPFMNLEDSWEKSLTEFSRPLAREYGTLNKRRSVEPGRFDPEYVCHKYGGCRMLTCNEFVHYIDDDFDSEVMVDWFTGYCDRCGHEIPHKHWAIREPLLNGGWRGCFCSFPCLERGALEKHPVHLKLFEQILLNVGINDRE